MELRDYHVHTTFSDGENSPEEMVRSALSMGMTELGFSDHSPMAWPEDWCMSDPAGYRREIARLKEVYGGRIRILCGIEMDYYSPEDGSRYDYRIGSVHFLRAGNDYVPVDESRQTLQEAAVRHFGGDVYALLEAYYATVAHVVEQTGADVIGHFDLVTKFNEHGELFDPAHPRYQAAWQAAADRLLKTGKPFELNTGAMSRGYRSQPYPAGDIRAYLKARGGRILLSSDSHRADTLCYGFSRFTGEAE